MPSLDGMGKAASRKVELFSLPVITYISVHEKSLDRISDIDEQSFLRPYRYIIRTISDDTEL